MYVQKALCDVGLLEVRQCQVMKAKDHVREIHSRLLKVERAQIFELAACDGKTLMELQYLDAERPSLLEQRVGDLRVVAAPGLAFEMPGIELE